MGLRKLTVTNATKTADGWRIVAQSPNKVVRFIDVDEEGTGDDCEPWDDELEEKFGAADPEHNVVILNHEERKAPEVEPEPERPTAEVVDINEKWAKRDKKIRDFVDAVNEGQERSAAAEHQANVKRFNDRVADLILSAKNPTEMERAKEAEELVVVYRDLSYRDALQFTRVVEDKLSEVENRTRQSHAPGIAYRELLLKQGIDINVRDLSVADLYQRAAERSQETLRARDQERKEAQRRAEARKADRHGTQ